MGLPEGIKRLLRKCRWLGELVLVDWTNPKKLFLFLQVKPYTMVGYKRLSNVYELARAAERRGISGAFVEFGVWKGGAAGAMAFVAKQEGSGRIVWLFDSFEGLPEPTAQDGAYAAEYASERTSGRLESIRKCVGPLEDVERLFFSMLGIPRGQVRIEKGWFQETLPGAKQEMGQVALLRLDADWYESTKYVLEELYDQVAPGGYVIIDDYGHWEGCKKAVDEFFEKRQLRHHLIPIDKEGVYFQK